jgi:ABC-type Fe3+ transport system permease subunit
VRVVELSIAGLLALAGLRSIWKWSRRAFEGTDVVDHVLYALFVTGRAGLWFSLAGFFVIYASVDARGRAAVDELEPFRWYLVVPLVLAGLQLAAGWFLGRRGPVSRRP